MLDSLRSRIAHLFRNNDLAPADFRLRRKKLNPDDFALPAGHDPAPSDVIDVEVWNGITSLPDDVSLRTSDHYGSELGAAWSCWGDWLALQHALWEAQPQPHDSATAYTALDAADYLQASVYCALTGYYRLAYTSLRAVVENVTLGMGLELGAAPLTFEDYKRGRRCNFAALARSVASHARVSVVETGLHAKVNDDLFGKGGLVLRLWGDLSRSAHARPGATDADEWESNGPIFVPEAFEGWAECYFTVYAVAVLECRLAQPRLNELDWGSSDARGLFARAVRNLPQSSADRKLLDAVPATVW